MTDDTKAADDSETTGCEELRSLRYDAILCGAMRKGCESSKDMRIR